VGKNNVCKVTFHLAKVPKVEEFNQMDDNTLRQALGLIKEKKHH